MDRFSLASKREVGEGRVGVGGRSGSLNSSASPTAIFTSCGIVLSKKSGSVCQFSL